jgi:copper homeostasis protein
MSLKLYVLVRPREGDFCYTPREFEVMRDDVRRAADLGADGVVIGVLTPDGRVDVERTAELVFAARPMQVTFNRAFDVAVDLDRSLEDVVAAGADRILTSGGERQGVHGIPKVAQLVRAAQGRIVILGGGGIRHANAREFILGTGVNEIHTSLRSSVNAPILGRNVEAILGADADGPLRHVVKDSEVLKLRKALDAIAASRNG